MEIETERETPDSRSLERLVRPRYWVCIIGPVEHDKLPDGADSPPRIAAQSAIIEMVGEQPVCNSGWCDEAEYRRIIEAKYLSV